MPRIRQVTVLFGLVIVLVISANTYFLRYFLSYVAERIATDFILQNSSELSNGDSLNIAARLSTLSGNIEWQCIFASKNDDLFFKLQKGLCRSSLITKEVIIDRTTQGGIYIRILIQAPESLLYTMGLFTIFPIFVSLIAAKVATKIERDNQLKSFTLDRIETEVKLLSLETKLRTESAIARTTQALAHDVRKPFSLLAMLMDALESAKTIEENKELLALGKIEVQESLTHVNTMIDDILLFGNDSHVQSQQVSVKEVFATVFRNLSKVYCSRKITVNLNLSHNFMVRGSHLRLYRAFYNIIENSIQAMPDYEQITIKSKKITHETNTYCSLTITNSGSFINKEHLANLFSPFFSYGKEHGTGLGLSISQKVITSFGGSIECDSGKTEAFPNGFVSFKITLNAWDSLIPDESLPETFTLNEKSNIQML